MNVELLETYHAELLPKMQQFQALDITKEKGYLARFAFFTANLANFLPHIPVAQHPSLFQEMLLHKMLETHDRTVPYLADISFFEENAALIIDNPAQPFIFCSFHLGSYRIVFNWLFRQHRPLIILARQGVFEHQLEEIMAFKATMVSLYNIRSDLQVINADDPSSALKLLRLLKAGYSLVAYLDANTGTGADQGEPVSFLNHALYVRRGLPFLSLAAQIPIVPVVAYRADNQQNTVRIGSPILPSRGLDKATFERQTLQQLFDGLAKYVAQYPAQWEVWSYLHEFMLPMPLVPQNPLFQKTTYRFNAQRYLLLNLEAEPALFDRRTYEVTHLTPELYYYLNQPQLDLTELPDETRQELLAQYIIV